MSHARQQIRDAVMEAVIDLATTGRNVWASRAFPLADNVLPGLIVFTDSEFVDEEMGKIAQLQHRELTVTIKGRDKLTAGLDDHLDDIAAEVEAAMFAANLGRVYALDLISTEMSLAEGLEMPVGEISLTYRVQYITAEGAPTTAI